MRQVAVLAGVVAVCTAVAVPVIRGQQQPPAPAGTPPAAAQAQPDSTTPQTSPQAPQAPVFRGGVNVIRVDVIVNDPKTGQPILDLKQEDFEITEGGKPQTINNFKLISLDGGLMATEPPRRIRTEADEEIEAARDDVRLFGIFLDDYHVMRDNARAARDQLARFVETQFGPSDMVALMYPLWPLDAVRASRNHDVLQRALREFVGRKYDYEVKSPMEEYVYHASAEQVEDMRNQVSLQAIKSMILKLGGLKDGRKSIILVSEGYSKTLPPQMRDQFATMPGFNNPAANNPLAPDRSFSQQFFAQMDMDMDFREVWQLANRYNVSINTVDPRGLATNEFGIERNISAQTDRTYLQNTMDTLRAIAENTDGRAIVNRNDFVVGMKQVIVDSSAYYLLGYNSTNTTPDGKYHVIDVKLKRKGFEVRHRMGYWALKPEDAARALAPAAPVAPNPIETALAAASVPRGRSVRTWIGTERGADGKTRVRLVWEPVALRAQDGVRAPARVVVTALGVDGTPYYRGRAPESAGPAVAGASVSFEVPPGPLQLRLVMEGANAGDVLDSENREIVVPDFTGPQARLGTPQVFRGRTPADLQRFKTDPNALPAAGREFSRAERLLITTRPYGPGQTPPSVTAKLLNRSSQPMSDVPVVVANGVAQAEVQLSSLGAGEYALEFTADGGMAHELVAFRVTP